MGALADMIRAGVDPDLVEKVALDMVAAASGAKPRSSNAERQARWRAKHRVTEITSHNASSEGKGVTRVTDGKKEGPQTPKEKTTPSDPSGPQGDVPSPMDESPKGVLFDAGLRWLCQVSRGKSEQQLRRLLGQMLRDIGGDGHAAQLLGIFRDAKMQGKADPVSWIQAMVRSRGGSRAGPPTDGVASYMRRLHEDHDGQGNFEGEPIYETGFGEPGSGGRHASAQNRDRDRPERPYLDLVAVGAK